MTILTNNLICGHHKYCHARTEFINSCLKSPPGWITLLLGPSGAGKSILLNEAFNLLELNNSKSIEDGNIPIVKLQLENTSDGRIKPRWIALELLKLLKHPIYKNFGTYNDNRPYNPSNIKDEGSLRSALKESICQRKTTHIILDEIHIVTATKNEKFRDSILESIKTALAINTSLILVGGYAFAKSGIFNSPHFVSRIASTIDIGYYRNIDPDISQWDEISKIFSKHLNLSDDNLLVDAAEITLDLSCGVYGNYEKWLWKCKQYSELYNVPISLDILMRFAPLEKSVDSIRIDQNIAEDYLKKASVNNLGDYSLNTANSVSTKEPNKKKPKKQKPFESNPSRTLSRLE